MPVRTDISPLTLLLTRVDAVVDGAAPPDGIPTGYPSLDKLLGGGPRLGDLVVLGGDVGSGKSALALSIALRARLAGHKVELITSESDIPRLLERALAMEGRAPIDNIRQGVLDEAMRASLGSAALRMRDAVPGISRISAVHEDGGPRDLAERVLALKGEGEVVIIDSLQGVPTGAKPQDEELAETVRLLKSAALDARVVVLLTAQLPALTRFHPDNRPVLDDFGALGAVKQHADIVLALSREELYSSAPGQEGATDLIVLKNRNGPTAYVDLYFYKQWLRFEDMVEP
ncbi:MAG TPA: DnaB-like helicase C-terminal domain-containing protein [Gemmatimonadaceae bacterium]|nr:DnaB-like helicase C-terminal domain-containing protein [Gemmatimonadaceae bacterium]